MVAHLLLIISVVALIGLWIAVKRKKMEQLRPALGIAGIAVLLSGGFSIVSSATSTMVNRETKLDKEQHSRHLAYQHLGSLLKKAYPDANIMTFIRPDDQAAYQSKARVPTPGQSIKIGLGGSLAAEEVLDVPRSEWEGRPRLTDSWYANKWTYQQLDASSKEWSTFADYIICAFGQPNQFDKSDYWKPVEVDKTAAVPVTRAKLIFVAPRGAGIIKALEEGAIEAVVASKASYNPMDGGNPATPKEAFEMRYVLITKANMKEVLAENPKIIK
jgi:hypothetical protein